MYKIVSAVSLIIRTFIFPNPFTKIFEIYLVDTVVSPYSSMWADLFNIFIGGAILCLICFPLVGIIYDKGDAPVIGSILYMVAVLLNSGILILVSNILTKPSILCFSVMFGIFLILEILILLGIRYYREGNY